jgi:hypothetical protein
MELSPFWETANCAATQELPSILWNRKIHYRVHNSPPLVPKLNQINPIHIILSYLSKIHFNIIHTPTSSYSQWSLLAFPSISYMHSSSPNSCYKPTHLILIYSIILIILGEEYKLEVSHYAVSPTSCHFIPLWSNYFSHQPQSMFLP